MSEVHDKVYVGFTQQPHGLDDFLSRQGFARAPNNGHYIQNGGKLLVQLNLESHPEKPDWSASGHTIVAEMQITYPVREREFDFRREYPREPEFDEALELAHRIARAYNAVIFETMSGEFDKEYLG